MKKMLWIGALLLAAIVLAGCSVDKLGTANAAGSDYPAVSGAAQDGEGPANAADQTAAEGAQVAGLVTNGGQNGEPPPTLTPEQEAAVEQFGDLTVGILYLQDNQPGSITGEQATKLLTYYQDIQTALEDARAARKADLPPEGGQQAGADVPAGPDGGPQGDGPAGVPGGPNDGPNGGPQGGGPDGVPGGPNGGPGGHAGRARGGVHALALIDQERLQTDLAGIQSTLSADQQAAIAPLTSEQKTGTLENHGMHLSFSGRPKDGQQPAEGGTPGATIEHKVTPSPDEMATMQAGGAPGPRPVGDPLIEEVIKVLEAITA